MTESLPFVAGSETSRAAAVSMGHAAATGRQRVLACLKEKGPLTDEQLQDELKMNPSTERPRRIELVSLDLVTTAGESVTRSGRRALLWKAVAP